MNAVDEFTKQFTTEKVPGVIQIKRDFFQVSDSLLEVKKSIKKEPFAIGLFLGSGRPLSPSIALIDWIGERTERYVVLDKKTSWLFLCDRDIFPDSIIKKGADDGLVIVKSNLNEVLGYGRYQNDRKIPIKNMLDKGDFIRREKH